MIVFMVLAVAHIVAAMLQRSRKSAELERRWIEEGQPGTWAAYEKEGLAPLERSLRQRLIWGVYAFPAALVGMLAILTNWD
ncbi:hypothetical protein Dshi_3019 [Dinoroseobacter shibae DFL 12 = DSM 16493]|uniref:Uncharacterized protein n=1 Tax=Dinoroseobacter shibae (strain DSM 16493 / NCIMB 14021 / DFL 12) TaxID=398580 RepID=A8LKG9_DINSH|nr:hypothetical protein Dshi_3019 [Dinoroseobacter shibae DFL 12 = DSM 16493]